MKHLILILFLIGCGQDDSNSSSTPATTETVVDENFVAPPCDTTKICSFHTIQEVIERIGDPSSVYMGDEKGTYTVYWKEPEDETDVCIEEPSFHDVATNEKKCWINFVGYYAVSFRDVNPEYIDVISFVY